ncbi:MAG: VOC family protein [Candidatus Polarisedimenticolia bacterium]
MIKGVHAMFYSSRPDELRSFIKDKLRLPYTDVGQGWLIFDLAEGDVGCHPTEGDPESGTHDVSFYCDDLEKTVAELKSRGVVFDEGIADHGYGFVTHLTMPGGVRLQIYQPKYVKGTSRPAARKAATARRRPAARAASKRSSSKAKGSKRAVAKRGRRAGRR